MKYQIVLESTTEKSAKMFSDDFEKMVEAMGQYKLPGFRLLYAQSLEGIKESVYQKNHPTHIVNCAECEGRGKRQDFSTSMDNFSECKKCNGTGKIDCEDIL